MSRIDQQLDLQWLRLNSGKVRHLTVPYRRSGAIPMTPQPAWRKSFCGRVGTENMIPHVVPTSSMGRILIQPGRFPLCKACQEILEAVTPEEGKIQ